MFGKSTLASLLGATLIASAIIATPATAQTPAPIWTGLYIGAHGGGGWGETGGEDAIDLSGGLGGLHGGYQWQSGNFLIGAEGDIAFGNISGEDNEIQRQNFFGTRVTSRLSIEASANTVASLKGRLGYVAGPVLLYAAGGVAFTWLDIDANASVSGGGQTFRQSLEGSDVLTGYTVGGGAEMKFTNSISGRIDVSHFGFNDDFSGGGIDIDDADLDFTVVRAGLTFHLN
ncbi:MAG: outer membrane beta-barrel protein [Alphaproteobacteria bacterium]|nr:outer membrane beta-barrel protein [Alphaproteobacteria bacterium]